MQLRHARERHEQQRRQRQWRPPDIWPRQRHEAQHQHHEMRFEGEHIGVIVPGAETRDPTPKHHAVAAPTVRDLRPQHRERRGHHQCLEPADLLGLLGFRVAQGRKQLVRDLVRAPGLERAAHQETIRRPAQRQRHRDDRRHVDQKEPRRGPKQPPDPAPARTGCRRIPCPSNQARSHQQEPDRQHRDLERRPHPDQRRDPEESPWRTRPQIRVERGHREQGEGEDRRVGRRQRVAREQVRLDRRDQRSDSRRARTEPARRDPPHGPDRRQARDQQVRPPGQVDQDELVRGLHLGLDVRSGPVRQAAELRLDVEGAGDVLGPAEQRQHPHRDELVAVAVPRFQAQRYIGRLIDGRAQRGDRGCPERQAEHARRDRGEPGEATGAGRGGGGFRGTHQGMLSLSGGRGSCTGRSPRA